MMNAAPSTKVASRPSTASVGEMMRPSVMDVTASADQNGNGERMLYVPMTWSAACAIVASGWSPQRSASRSATMMYPAMTDIANAMKASRNVPVISWATSQYATAMATAKTPDEMNSRT